MADAKLLATFQLGLSSRSTKPEKFVLLKRKGIVWTRCEELGRGSFGVVWLEKARDGERRALKEVEKKYLNFDYNRELLAMAKLSKVKRPSALARYCLTMARQVSNFFRRNSGMVRHTRCSLYRDGIFPSRNPARLHFRGDGVRCQTNHKTDT